MKIVVVGGTGLIGKKLVRLLEANGHEAIAASPSKGVNALTGAGLTEALQSASILIDVSNAPSYEANAVMQFFETSTRHLLEASKVAKLKHYIALSVVGADRLVDSGYMRAKVVQENQIKAAGIPYTIVRATQFYEFLGTIADGSASGDVIRLPVAPMQPLATDDVAAALAEIALAVPRNETIDLAGPQSLSIAEFISKYLTSRGDLRTVIADVAASYFGAILDEQGLNPGENPQITPTTFDEWCQQVSVAK